jgi:hypothetical protein
VQLLRVDAEYRGAPAKPATSALSAFLLIDVQFCDDSFSVAGLSRHSELLEHYTTYDCIYSALLKFRFCV